MKGGCITHTPAWLMAALFFIDVYPYGIILRSLLRLHITQLSTHSLYLVYLEYRYPIREDDEED